MQITLAVTVTINSFLLHLYSHTQQITQSVTKQLQSYFNYLIFNNKF